MSDAWGHAIGVVTVILMLIFIGIWVWAWRKKHKPAFDKLARLPLEDDIDPPGHDDKEAPR